MLLGGLFVNYTLFGISITLIGATMPAIIRSLEWSYTEAGIVMASGSVGYFLSTFWSSVLIERLEAKKVIIGSLVLVGSATGLFGLYVGVFLTLLLC